MALMKQQRRGEPPKPTIPEPIVQTPPELEPEPELQPRHESDIPEEYRSPLE